MTTSACAIGLLDLEARRHEQADASGEDLVEVPHPVDRALEDRHAGAETEGDDRGVVADDAAAEDDDVAGLDARCPRQEDAAPAERLLEEVGGRLRREPAGDLAHRGEQRQAAVVGLDGLVRDGRDPAVRERPRERLVGGDVEIREEHEPFAQPRVLGLDRLLDLQQEVGLAPGLVDRDDPGTRPLVLLVGERAPLPRRRLDENLVPALDQLAGARRRERHAVLVGLDLLRNADTQGPETLSRRRGATKSRGTSGDSRREGTASTRFRR